MPWPGKRDGAGLGPPIALPGMKLRYSSQNHSWRHCNVSTKKRSGAMVSQLKWLGKGPAIAQPPYPTRHSGGSRKPGRFARARLAHARDFRIAAAAFARVEVHLRERRVQGLSVPGKPLPGPVATPSVDLLPFVSARGEQQPVVAHHPGVLLCVLARLGVHYHVINPPSLFGGPRRSSP